jgi:Flp pilus assembly protein TadD
MAANIPEFVRARPDAIQVIRSEFIEDLYHVRTADKHALAGRLDAGLAEIEKAVAINPQRARTYRLWGVMLMAQGKLAEAEARIQRAVELRPEDRRAYWNLGRVAALRGRPDDAEACYRKAVELDPFFISPRLDLAALLVERGRSDEAVEQLTEGARAEPKDPRPHGLLGDCYAGRGEPEKAAAAYEQALRRDPNSVHALARLASIRITDPNSSLYHPQQAMRLATKACELTKYRDPQALIVLSEVFAVTGSQEDAVSSATAALGMAETAGDQELTSTIRTKLERFKRLFDR